MDTSVYLAIDLKSFYASVECVARGLDPLKARLVVADESRTDKTICLAVSPALKAYGIPGRARLFDVKQKLRGKTLDNGQPVDFIVARPRMAEYLAVSRKVVAIYESFVSPDDIHKYSVDEVFIDVTSYLPVYKCSAHELAIRMIREVLRQTGITATAGIGTNLYLAKVAMDIVAKHIPADADGVRIAELNERQYREQLWTHRPLTSFWRIGKGIASHLERYDIHTMGDLARLSITHGPWLYKQFGVQAELLIDHAWGWEPCTIADIKAYKPETHSLSSGQVLSSPYTWEKARVVIQEMAEGLAYELLAKQLVTDEISITINYDSGSLDYSTQDQYASNLKRDYYGRLAPKPAHGSHRLREYTYLATMIMEGAAKLYDEITNRTYLIRRLTIVAEHVVAIDQVGNESKQLCLFETDDYQDGTVYNEVQKEKAQRLQEAVLRIKNRYGKNSLLKGLNYADGSTARDRNGQIGGHRAGEVNQQ